VTDVDGVEREGPPSSSSSSDSISRSGVHLSEDITPSTELRSYHEKVLGAKAAVRYHRALEYVQVLTRLSWDVQADAA
jgi:hypothetical protein